MTLAEVVPAVALLKPSERAELLAILQAESNAPHIDEGERVLAAFCKQFSGQGAIEIWSAYDAHAAAHALQQLLLDTKAAPV